MSNTKNNICFEHEVPQLFVISHVEKWIIYHKKERERTIIDLLNQALDRDDENLRINTEYEQNNYDFNDFNKNYLSSFRRQLREYRFVRTMKMLRTSHITKFFYRSITKVARSKHEYTSIICILQNLRFRFNVFSSRTRLRCEARIILFIFIFISIDFSSIIQIYTQNSKLRQKQTISNRTTHSSSYKWKMRESHNKYDFE